MIFLIVLLAVLPFAAVLLFGAPYLPTRKRQAQEALDLLGLKKGEVFVDLGCGDGVMLVHAAKRGLVAHGYELNPLVWLVAWLRCFRYKNAHVHLKNYWNVDLPKETKGIYVFLLDPFMERLDKKLGQEAEGVKLVSYTFKIPGKKSIATKNALNLYKY